MERANRTVGETLEGIYMETRYHATDALSEIIAHDNQKRLPRASGFVTPEEVYRGQPKIVHQAGRVKMNRVRYCRKSISLEV